MVNLYVKGGGFQVEGVKLGKQDADALQSAHKDLGDELFLGGHLIDNTSVGEPLFETCYGPNPFDSTFAWEDSSEDPGIDDSNFSEIAEFVDFQNYEPNQLEFYCVGYGKVFGFAEIPISDPAEFESEKFVVEYFRFVLDGWPELSGSVISRITYDGQEVEFEPEDNGLDVDTFLLGREYEDGEVLDDIVLHESRAGEHQSVDWGRLSKAFS